jgi:hypothetical protein
VAPTVSLRKTPAGENSTTISVDRGPMTTVGVAGLGAVGLRAARALTDEVSVERVVLESRRPEMVVHARDALGRASEWGTGAEPTVVVLAGESGPAHVERARAEVRRGRSVVSVSDAVSDVDGLLSLDELARERGVTVAVGVAFSPGLSSTLARHAASTFSEVHEIRTAFVGAGGPRCLSNRREVLGESGVIIRDGTVHPGVGGSSTELTWFPDPVAGVDCSLGALAEPTLLRRAFATAGVIESRGAVGRESLATLLPWRPAPPEGDVGAIRVEVIGRRDGDIESITYGVLDRPAAAAGITAGIVAAHLAGPAGESVAAGALGLAEFFDPVVLLSGLKRRGVRAATVEAAV